MGSNIHELYGDQRERRVPFSGRGYRLRDGMVFGERTVNVRRNMERDIKKMEEKTRELKRQLQEYQRHLKVQGSKFVERATERGQPQVSTGRSSDTEEEEEEDGDDEDSDYIVLKEDKEGGGQGPGEGGGSGPGESGGSGPWESGGSGSGNSGAEDSGRYGCGDSGRGCSEGNGRSDSWDSGGSGSGDNIGSNYGDSRTVEMMRGFLQVLRDESERDREYLRRNTQEARYLKWAREYAKDVPELSLKDLVEGNRVGWKNCRKWITELEKYPDQIRKLMAPFCMDQVLRQSVNVELATTEWTEHISWQQIRERVTEFVPDRGIWIETSEIMKQTLGKDESVQACVAKVLENYRYTCNFFNVTELPVSLGQVVAAVVTGGMSALGRNLYSEPLLKDYRQTVKEMDKSFQDTQFKESVFLDNSEEGKAGECASWESSDGQKCQGLSCWYYDQGWCKYGSYCRYIHQQHGDLGYESVEGERDQIGSNELGGSWYDRVKPYRKDDRKYTIG